MAASLDQLSQLDDDELTARFRALELLRCAAEVETAGMVTAELLRIFQQFVDAEFVEDVAARTAEFGPDAPASMLPRTDAQRRFDALTELFRAAALAPADGVAPTPVVNVLVGLRTLERILARRGMGVEPEACLSGVGRRVVIDSASVVIDAGRKRRLFTGVAREVALLLWHRCVHLGCAVPADQCEVDHMDEWDGDGGGTDQVNARPRCGTGSPRPPSGPRCASRPALSTTTESRVLLGRRTIGTWSRST